MTDPEPRRSVRATKGQHTKSFDALENGPDIQPRHRIATTKKPAPSKKRSRVKEEENDDDDDDEDEDDGGRHRRRRRRGNDDVDDVDDVDVNDHKGGEDDGENDGENEGEEDNNQPAEDDDGDAGEEEEEEEIIRCVCGATTQDDPEPEEPWIACEKCGVWQHNVCMGISIYFEDIPDKYLCEQCDPPAHKELSEATERGEKLWEDRRASYNENKKKKRPGKRGKGKRQSDVKTRERGKREKDKMGSSPAVTPAPSESAAATIGSTRGKRKTRAQSFGGGSSVGGSAKKLRKGSDGQPVVDPAMASSPATALTISPQVGSKAGSSKAGSSKAGSSKAGSSKAGSSKAGPKADPKTVDKLEGRRKSHAQVIQKALNHAMDTAIKQNLFILPTDTDTDADKDSMIEGLAVSIEQAVFDAHEDPMHQTRALDQNLKRNVGLAVRVFNRELSPATLATMTHKDLATPKLQRQTAEMQALVDKQSILKPEDMPRPVRFNRKGEELLENDNYVSATVMGGISTSNLHRKGVADLREARDQETRGRRRSTQSSSSSTAAGVGGLSVDMDTLDAEATTKNNFDLNQVYSAVSKAPAQGNGSGNGNGNGGGLGPHSFTAKTGPGDDPDVDRLLRDDNDNNNDNDAPAESPPYSPADYTDPEIIWNGPLTMTNVADVEIVAKFVGGSNLSIYGVPWKSLIPPLLTLAGRIPEDKANPYLLSLRWNTQIDVVIMSLAPANPADDSARKQFHDVINYFLSKKRYGVVGERTLGNVRDTYLIPVARGDDPLPGILQNIENHTVPLYRPESLLLMLFIVRDEQAVKLTPQEIRAHMEAPPQPHPPLPSSHSQQDQQQAGPAQISGPVPTTAAPVYSPATPQTSQGAFQAVSSPQRQQQLSSQTPVPPPTTPSNVNSEQDISKIRQALNEGEQKARAVLGPLFNSPTVTFLLPHASRMKEGEWAAVKRCLERDPRAKDDLPLLSRLLTEEGNQARSAGAATVVNGAVQAGQGQAQVQAAQGDRHMTASSEAQTPATAAQTGNSPLGCAGAQGQAPPS